MGYSPPRHSNTRRTFQPPAEATLLRLGLEPNRASGGIRSQPKLRLGLEPMGSTRTHCLFLEITHLVSGLNEAQVLYISAQKEFSERQSDR